MTIEDAFKDIDNVREVLRNDRYDLAYDVLTIVEQTLKKEFKTGKWVLVEMGDTDLHECSLCRNRKTYTPPFCDICGARMEGSETDGTDD